MRIVKCGHSIDKANHYTICNVPGVVNFEVDKPVQKSFEVPPIGIYYVTWNGKKKPLDDLFSKHCVSYMSNDIWRNEELAFLFENLVPILRGEIDGWRLMGVDDYPTMTLWIANAESHGRWFFINLEPQCMLLKLCFESQNSAGETIQHRYRLWRQN